MSFISRIKSLYRRLLEDDNLCVVSPENLVLEECTSIGPKSRIMNLRAKFVMKKYSFSGPELLVVTGDHMPVLGIPMIKVSDAMKDQLDTEHRFDRDVIVEEDVWLGARVTLLSGVTVGRGCIVAAGSVVVNNIPPYHVAAGVPAKPVKLRYSAEEIIEHEKKVYPENERFTREEIESFL